MASRRSLFMSESLESDKVRVHDEGQAASKVVEAAWRCLHIRALPDHADRILRYCVERSHSLRVRLEGPLRYDQVGELG